MIWDTFSAKTINSSSFAVELKFGAFLAISANKGLEMFGFRRFLPDGDVGVVSASELETWLYIFVCCLVVFLSSSLYVISIGRA